MLPPAAGGACDPVWLRGGGSAVSRWHSCAAIGVMRRPGGRVVPWEGVVAVLRTGSRRRDGAAAAARKGPEWFGEVMSPSPLWRRGGRNRRRFGLNRFGKFALEAWSTLAPTALSQIPDAQTHFSALGEQAQSEWATLWPQLVEPDRPGEDTFTKSGRIEAAKMQAEEMIRAELLTPSEDQQDDEPGEGPGPMAEVIEAWRQVTEEG